MDNLYYWIKPVYKSAISIAIILERMDLFLKQFEDSVGGVTGSEGIREGILCQVYPDLLGIVIESIDDELKTRRRHCCQRRRCFFGALGMVTDGEVDWSGLRNCALGVTLSDQGAQRPLQPGARTKGRRPIDLPNLEVVRFCVSKKSKAHHLTHHVGVTR